MNSLDKFKAGCEGQISLFNGFLKEMCDTKPEVGTRLIFHYFSKDYECVVKSHCGHDYFYVEFTGRKPQNESHIMDGYHLSLRCYKSVWDFPDPDKS